MCIGVYRRPPPLEPTQPAPPVTTVAKSELGLGAERDDICFRGQPPLSSEGAWPNLRFSISATCDLISWTHRHIHPSYYNHHDMHATLHLLAAAGSCCHCESSMPSRSYPSCAITKPTPKMRRRRGHMTVVLFCTSIVSLGQEECKGRSNQAEEITGNIAIKNHRPGELVSLVYVDPCVASWGDGRSKMRLSRLWNTLIPRTHFEHAWKGSLDWQHGLMSAIISR